MQAKIKHNLIELNHNPAGFIKKGKATVDKMFEHEKFDHWLRCKNLEVIWLDGVFEQLIENLAYYENDDVEPLKYCRIYQIKPNFNTEVKFLALKDTVEKYGFPQRKDYNLVYDNEVFTNDLERLYDIFSTSPPDGYKGHLMSISDVVELYNSKENHFYYVDKFDFKEIEFELERGDAYWLNRIF